MLVLSKHEDSGFLYWPMTVTESAEAILIEFDLSIQQLKYGFVTNIDEWGVVNTDPNSPSHLFIKKLVERDGRNCRIAGRRRSAINTPVMEYQRDRGYVGIKSVTFAHSKKKYHVSTAMEQAGRGEIVGEGGGEDADVLHLLYAQNPHLTAEEAERLLHLRHVPEKGGPQAGSEYA